MKILDVKMIITIAAGIALGGVFSAQLQKALA